MAQWQFVTQVRAGDAIADQTGLRDRKLSFQLNRPCLVSASIRANDGKARRDSTGGLKPGVHELMVYRDGAPQETVFQLTQAQVDVSASEARVAFEWQGISSYLQDALVYPQTTPYSSTTLPWTWINTFQSRTGGSYGITSGTTTGTPPTRSKTITQEANLLDTIQQLSESGDGFDYRVNTSRGWDEWHTSRGADNGLVLEYGVNVNSFSWTEGTGPGEITNAIFVIGPPGTTVVTATDSTSRTTYGRREAAASFFADFEDSTVTNGQLQAHADKIIAERPYPKIIPQLRLVIGHQSIEWGAYWLGDTVTFRARVGDYDTINAQYRIVQIDVDLDDNDNETVTLGLNEVTS